MKVRQHSRPVEPTFPSHTCGPDLLLINPEAGGGLALEVFPRLQEFASQRNWPVEFCVTQSPEDLASRARNAAASGRQRILVLGGDGTFQVLINALTDFPETVLGVIPAGGGNDLAAALELPADPIQAAEVVLRGEVSLLDVVQVRTADGRERRYTGGGGVGLDAEAARYASGAYRHLRGRVRYLLAAIRALVGFHSMRVRVHLAASDPQTLKANVLVAGVLNTPSYGAGVCLAPEARMDDGRLDLVLLDHLSAMEILRLLPALASRGELKTHRVRRFHVEKVRIETETPRWFHGDGELLGLTPVEITVVPRAIRVLRAPRQAPA